MAKRTGGMTAVALGAVLGLAGVAGAAKHVQVKQSLSPTAAAPSARGKAKLTLHTASRGAFAVAAQRLAPATSYDVVVGGIKVGALTTGARGAGKVRFSAPQRGHGLRLGFDPRGASLAVRDAHGDDVLEGDLPDDSVDPNAVACCVSDGGESECELRTPDACAAAGGVASSASGCFPDPCNGTPGSVVVCCTGDSAAGAFCDDDPKVECEDDVTEAQCAARHGTVVTATSCEPDPCAPVPPADLVVCCVPEDGETKCEIRTADRCAAHGGTASTALSCHPNPCGGGGGDHQGGDDQGENSGGDGNHDGGHSGGD